MFNAMRFLRQAVVALALAGSSLAALAAPISFHVDIDTTSLADGGFLDLQFNGLLPATPATATFSNFSGAFGATDFMDNVVLNLDGSFTLANGPDFGSYLSFNVGFGGLLGFDVLFNDDYSLDGGTDGSSLTVGLFNEAGAIGSDDGIIARIDLIPGFGADAQVTGQFATIGAVDADVPEPSDWMLMATGLALLGFTLRRSAR